MKKKMYQKYVNSEQQLVAHHHPGIRNHKEKLIQRKIDNVMASLMIGRLLWHTTGF